jgi:heptosyltransferase-3
MTYGNYPNLSSIKRVLVIKMRHHGDVLLSSPVFSNLKRAIPDAHIDALVYKDTLPMLEGHPDISQFLTYDRSWKSLSFFGKLAKELSLLKTIRSAGYDLVINLTEGDRGAIAAWFSGSAVRVGFDPEKKGFFGKRKIYTHVVKNTTTPRHTVEKQLDALRCIGIFPKPEERDLTLVIPGDDLSHIRERINASSYVLIHPVSRWRFKCPPPSFFSNLITELHAQGKQIVLTSGSDKQEMAMIGEIIRLIPQIPVINLAGQTTLKQLAAAVRFSETLICVDSVPLHMASALKTPVIALFGPSSDQNWGPWMHPQGQVVAQQFSCRPCFKDGCGGSKMSDCLFTLPVSRVLDAFDAVQLNLK